MDTLSALFESDTDKAVKGVPIVVGYNSREEEVVFWIAEAGNVNHIKAQRKYAKQLEVSRKNAKQTEKLMKRIIAESILIRWKGVLDKDGNEIEPTLENKLDALLKYRPLYLRILEESNDHDNYSLVGSEHSLSVSEATKDTEKNSEAS